jgi:hypothetical protein
MRLWSIHPTYLDSKGLVAVWREGLLALHVLKGQTRGYTRHPQLIRFKNQADPLGAITMYLHAIVDEAESRQFSFKRNKLAAPSVVEPITVTLGQIKYESEHLKKKLFLRDKRRFLIYASLSQFQAHPLFKVVPGEREEWEKLG